MSQRKLCVVLLSLLIVSWLGVLSAQAAQAQVLDRGALAIRTFLGIDLAKEEFTFERLENGNFKLSGQIKLLVFFGTSETFILDKDLRLISYQRQGTDIQGPLAVSVQVQGKTATMTRIRGKGDKQRTRRKIVTTETEFAILDNNVLSEFVLLPRMAEARLAQSPGAKFSFTGLSPGQLRASPDTIYKGEPLFIRVGKKVLQVERYITAGGLELLVNEGKLIGVSNEGDEKPFIFREDIFPNGFTILRPQRPRPGGLN